MFVHINLVICAHSNSLPYQAEFIICASIELANKVLTKLIHFDMLLLDWSEETIKYSQRRKTRLRAEQVDSAENLTVNFYYSEIFCKK